MRLAAVALIAVLTTTGVAAQIVYGQATAPSVSIAITTVSVRDESGIRSHALLLWNRNIRSRPIGHGIEACVKASEPRGEVLLNCDLTLALPLGKVTASGMVHDFGRYTLVITGGTGVYVNARGPLFVRKVTGDGVRRLTFAI